MELFYLWLYQPGHELVKLMLWLGKGKKDRMVAIGQRVIDLYDKYLMEISLELYTNVE